MGIRKKDVYAYQLCLHSRSQSLVYGLSGGQYPLLLPLISPLVLLQTAVPKTADRDVAFLIPPPQPPPAIITPSYSNSVMLAFKATDLCHRPRKPGLGTVARAATLIAVVACAVVAARTAIPYAAAVITAAIPVVRAWMTPPLLFAAIHFIILIIWKLSENKNPDDSPPLLVDDKPPAKIASPEIPQAAAVEIFAKSEVIIPNNYPDVGRSMSDQNTDLDIKLDFLEIEKIDFTIMSVEEPPVVLAAAAEDDSMEVRWKAIMQGGAAPVVRFTLPEAVAGGWLVREASEVGEEDLNERFDAFIKKNYEQIRVATALRNG